jgi:hypothetical protein
VGIAALRYEDGPSRVESALHNVELGSAWKSDGDFLKLKGHSQCIDFDGSGSSGPRSHAGVKMWSCANQPYTKWEFFEKKVDSRYGNEYGLIRLKEPNPGGKDWCLDVSSGEYNKKPQGASVVLWPCGPDVARWTFTGAQRIKFVPELVPNHSFTLHSDFQNYEVDDIWTPFVDKIYESFSHREEYAVEYCLDFWGSSSKNSSNSGDKVLLWYCGESPLYVDTQIFSK